MKDKPKGFFDLPEWWKKEWQGMPEFVQGSKPPFQTILVHFKREEDVKAFAELVKQTINPETKFIWYPKKKPENLLGLRCADSKKRKRTN
jgi:hypothetical protein